MNGLDDLLKSARLASSHDRISFRDTIAEYRADAIPAMQRWVTDPELGAFAVRVLGKIGDQPGHRQAVIRVLESIDPSSLSKPVAGDVSDALLRLRGGRVVAAGGGQPRPPADWAGYAAAPPLEQRFHDDMLDIFRLAGEATRKPRPDGTVERGYWASYFLRGVRNHGGLAYAHQLLRADGTTDGFKRLTDERRLDLTMEALVLRPEYESLFSEHERQIASSRLARAGYEPPRS